MEVLHDTPAHKVLRALHDAGGVVEHFLFALPPTVDPHRAVAHACLEALLKRNLPVWRRYPKGWNDFELTTVDWECFAQAVPLPLSPQDFLNLDYEELGYAYCVLSPPHGLRGTDTENTALLEQLCQALFGSLDTLEIYAWPPDCSNYFDAGKDWWGSFFWTVYSPTYDWYVGILASTTD